MELHLSVQAAPIDRRSWLALARRVEQQGLDALVVADHPGTWAAPFVALAAAAAVTERITLGSCVVNAGRWEPVQLASEVATLDVVSGGRALLGIGAGHTPSEWTAIGRRHPAPAERVAHLEALALATRDLLAGHIVNRRTEGFALVDAELSAPRPVQPAVPVLVGGNGTRLLRFAARHADVVGVTGLGRTLADGHYHEARWGPAAMARTVDLVRRAGGHEAPELDVLVQHVEVTNDAEGAARRLAGAIPGTERAELLDTPFVWIGTAESIRDRLRAHRQRFGVRRYTVRTEALDAVEQVLATAP